MHAGAEVGDLKEDTRHAEASAPHTFNEGILLWRIHHSRPMTDLLRRKEVSEEMRHELTALVGGHNMRGKLMRETHAHPQVSEKEVKAALSHLLEG